MVEIGHERPSDEDGSHEQIKQCGQANEFPARTNERANRAVRRSK